MKTKIIAFLSVLGIVIVTTALFSINNTPTMKGPYKGDKYKKLWAKVDSLEKLGLTKSALEAVELIYKKAKDDKNSDQIIKAFVFRMKYKNALEENAFEAIIKELDNEIKIAEFPDKNVMNSMLAEMYWMYYQNNRWKFQNRTNTVNFNNDDLQTWTLDNIVDQVIKHYNQSLTNQDQLQNTPMETYDEIITWGTQPKNIRPTLYDFLANRALDFFSNTEVSVTKPADYFQLKEDYYFADARTFFDTNIKTNDTLSIHFQAIHIFQNVLKFRIAQSNDDAFIDANLRRISFVQKFSVNQNKNALYLDFLNKEEQKYKSNPLSSEISFLIAKYYFEQSSNYSFFDKNSYDYKDFKKKTDQICKTVITNFPKSTGADKCKSLQVQLRVKNLLFQVEKEISSRQKFPVRVEYSNIDKLFARVASISREKLKELTDKYYSQELYDHIVKNSKLINVQAFTLPVDDDFNVHSTELILNELPIGFYVVIIANNDKFSYDKNLTSYDFLTVSNIAYVQQKEEDGSYNIHVIDRKTGQPIAGVTAQTWFEKYNYTLRKYKRVQGEKYISNTEGAFRIKTAKSDDSKYLFVDLKKDSDYISSENSLYMYYSKYEKYKSTSITFYTDRAIYRPGQTVFFKGIVLGTINDTSEIIPKFSTTVTFYDVNYQKISDLNVTSNEYGTFSGSFAIPTGLLNGNMQLYTVNGNKTFKVEEYKRPSFETEILPLDGNYLLGDMVEVKGSAKTYAGANLTEATVKYRIIRAPRWLGWWSYFFKQAEVEVQNGTVITDDFGQYKIKFKAIPDLSIAKGEFVAFNYRIVVDVTDINGETQSTSKTMSVGYRALQVSTNINPEINKAEIPNFQINSVNLNGEFIPAKGTVKIFKQKEPSTFYHAKKWQRTDKKIIEKEVWDRNLNHIEYNQETDYYSYENGEKVFEYAFDTQVNKKLDLSSFSQFSSGRYVAEIVSKDAFGNEVSSKSFFTLFSEKDTQMPYKSPFFVTDLNSQVEPGEKARYIIGTSDEDVKILLEIEHRQKIVKHEWITLSNQQKLIEIPIEEKHRGNVVVHFWFIKENRLYNTTHVVMVPYTNKELDIKFETFRDKLQPGQNEEWKMVISGKKGEKLAAELLATLYDASLDAFAVNTWWLNAFNSYYTNMPWSSTSFGISNSQLLKTKLDEYYYPTYWSYNQLNWFNFNYYSYYSYNEMDMMADGFTVKSTAVNRQRKYGERDESKKMDEAEETNVAQDKDMPDAKTVIPPPPPVPLAVNIAIGGNADAQENFNDVKVRTNFNETAFFYPHLETNENGEVIVKFTIPESLTKWKMMGFAHTKDLKYGFIQNTLVTQKTLMVMPNVPRFFREDDEMEFPVKINNLSEKDLAGSTQLEFFDALTMKPIEGIMDGTETAIKKFEVKAGGNSLVTWKLKIPSGIGAVMYKIVAKAGDFSDGEQKTLPVMTNRMLVTESMPLPIRSKETKIFKFEKLLKSGDSKTLKNFRLTLEFTSNPVWYAIQALPYLMEYPYECSEQTFSRYYANSIASHIANSNPKIKQVFDSWKDSKESLLSNLEKNQELKSVLLEETPWVLNSQNESQRKKTVGLLFDLNKMSSELSKALKKLQKDQTSNGGWPWFKGMPESRYITQHIVTGMGHLDRLGVKSVREDEASWNMVKKAIGFLDEEIRDEYKQLKKFYTAKELEENHLSYTTIHYMYGRSFFKDVDLPSFSKDAFNYFKGQMEKYWLTQDLYAKGMIALVLNRYENKKIANDIVKSIKENSLSNDELGMYWKDNVVGYYWYQAPIETHALMVEVFDEVTNDQKAVDDLKVWLLKQKQTQDWKTTKATVEACYALLLKGTNWIANDELCKIKLGNMEVDPYKMDDVKVEAGTGYFKVAWTKGDIKPEMGTVTVTKTNEGVSWGALYWQYFEQLDKITSHETPLKLKKQLFKELITDRGRVIEPITEKSKLSVGDKVMVRIELRVDRDMEYVHLRDMRASAFEPINVISRYKYQDGLGYYESTKDASTNFFIGWLPKGTYVFEYPLRVTHNGNFSNGITTIQCMYAPEFTSNSEGIRVKIEK